MSKDQKDDFLRYGQGILLSGFKEERGFLTAKGFADTTAKYQTYRNILYFKNYRNAIFQIIPAANFEINDELRKILEVNSEETPNVKILKARAKSEQEQFNLHIQNKEKQQVCFGDTVIFKHVDSDTFLSGTIRPSNGSNGAFTVEVTKSLSEILVYKVLPFRSYERIGMPIPFDSPIKLLNTFNNGYLTYEKIGTNTIQKKIDLDKNPIKADDSYIIPVKTNSAESLTYESVTHFVDLSTVTEDPMPWKFVLHMKEVQNDSLIQHDIIYFQHTENDGVLSTKGKDIILKQMKTQGGDQLPFYECLWEIEKHDLTKDAYILRHLMSGMTLGIVKGPDDKPIKPELFDISEGQAESKLGWVELKLAKKEKVDINSKSLINICLNQWCLDKVKDTLSIDNDEEEDVSTDYVSISKLNKMAVNELEYETKNVKFTLEISKNCFIIKEIEDDLKKQVLFALSFHSKIIDLREDLKWGFEESEQKITYIRMMQVTEKIKQIKDFLKNCPKELSDREYIKPIYKRQMICKDLGISELLFELLFYMRKNLEGKYKKKESTSGANGNSNQLIKNTYIFQTKHNQLQKFEELYNSIYEVIYELIRDNLLFKIYISKWINFVIQDVLTENQPSHLNLLKEMFKDNEFLVKNFVSDNLVEKLSSRMINQKQNFIFYEKKYLQIFRLFCIVGETINTSNQIKILNYFIKQLRTDDIRALYQITLSKKDDEIYTEAAIDKNILKKRRFGDYYKICKEQYISAWEYFVQFLNLIADMTKGRNKTVESYMESMFTIDILSDLFEKEQLHEAQVPIIRLLHNLYAESQKFYPIQKKKRISDFDTLAVEVVDVMTTTSDVKPWNPPLKRVLDCLQRKLKEYGPIDPKAVQKNQNLYQILNFIWQTFNLGFWEKKEQVKEILQDIMRVLEPHPVVTKNYAEASIESKENVLMMRCKLECMHIIQFILDYDLDLNVRYICKHFQKFQMPPKKRALVQDEGTRMLEYRVDNQVAVKFIQQLPKDNIELVESSILNQMIELSKYNNPKLTSQSISIMERVLLKRKKAIEDFCLQIFVCGEERINLKKYIEARKNKFYTMQDQTLVSVSMLNQAGNYVFIYKEDKQSGIMQDIYMMSQIIKNQSLMKEIGGIKTLESSGMFKKLGTEKLLNFTDERTSSNFMKQSVLDAENIHLKILQFILNCTEVPTEQLALKLLHLSYKFLVSLIWNFQTIKPTLIPYIPNISHHLRRNVGCIDFLKEMYDNNKTMLFNEVGVIKLVKEICCVIENQPDSSYYKSKLFDFFRFLIYCNGKSLKFNQIQILKVMQDDSYKKIILDVTKEDIRQLVAKYEEDYAELQDKKGMVVKIEPKLTYMITYFQILESLIDDRNTVNMGKLKKRFPFDTLVDWVAASKSCWPLKRNIRAFLNRLYYFQPEIQIHMKKIIGSELNNIIGDLNEYILIKCKSDCVDRFQFYYFQNPVRFSYLESYLYLNLQQNLFTLYELTTREKIEAEMKTILHPIDNTSPDGPYNFIRICERLGFIKNYFTTQKNVYTNSFIKFLLSKFRNIISEFDDNIYLPGMLGITSGLGRAPTKPQKERARVGLIQKIMAGDISTFYSTASGTYNENLPLVYLTPEKMVSPKDDKKPNQNKLLNKLRQILKRQKVEFKTEDDRIDYKLNRLVKAIKLSPTANAFLINDYNNNLRAYSQNPSIFDYITIIIQMNSNNPEALPNHQKQFFLNLITGIVEQNNKVELKQLKFIDEWEADDWSTSKESISGIQNKLKSCQLGRFITELLKENIWDNIEFADSILLCGISYLFGGNTNTQKNMIEQIGADSQNRVMRNIETLISKLGKFILKNIEQAKKPENDQKNQFSTTTIDNYDFYDLPKRYVHRKNVFEPETTDEEIYSKTCIRTYRRAFKFLQLLCENNNIQGKNFIRDQPNGVKKFNFINIATKEVRNLFQALNSEICGVAMFLLDFILEVTQIPVKANQDALMNLTFFEDVCGLQNYFSKPDNISLRGFDGRESMIEEIYFKSIQIILSNFEGNQQKTFFSLDSKLQPRFLVNILTKKLTEMGVSCKQDVIQYIDNLTECVFDENMMAVLNIIIIFLKLKEKLKDASRIYSMYQKIKSQNQDMYEYLQKCLLEIEIVNSGQNQTIIFPKYPVFNSLSGNLRDNIMDLVLRTTHRDKIVSLLTYTSAIKTKIQSSYSLLKIQKIAESHMNDAFKISAITSIIICVYMIYNYDVLINYGEADFSSSRVIGLGRFVLSLIQLSMSLVYAYYWIKFRIWQQPQKHSYQSEKHGSSVDETQQETNKYVKLVTDKIKTVTHKLKIDVTFEFIHRILKGGDTTQPLYVSAEFYRVALYVCVAFVGTFFHPAIFFLHIMDIFCYNPEIGDIFKAIAINIKQLAYVSFMGVVFTFVFCTVTFSNYMKNVYSGDQPTEQMCQSMLDCIFQLFVSGAIGETMQSFQIVRFAYDMIYGIFFGILFSNIISGIMLDSFGALRERNNELMHDKENFCYICNISREALQKNRVSFQDHIHGKHFLWNYVFFIYFLDNKSPTDYSGMQYQITTQYNRSQEQMFIDWVPLGEPDSFDCKAKLQQMSEVVEQKVKYLQQNNGEIERILKEFKEIAQEYMV